MGVSPFKRFNLGSSLLMLAIIVSSACRSTDRGELSKLTETTLHVNTDGRGIETKARFMGRHHTVKDTMGHFLGIRCAWTGCGFSTSFYGTSLTLIMESLPKDDIYFQVIVDEDEENSSFFHTTQLQNEYEIVKNLDPTQAHVVTLYRRTEGGFGPVTFADLKIDPTGKFIQVGDYSTSKIFEFIGDSLTAGYGNLGCPHDPAHQDGFNSYGSIASRAFKAEHTIIAGSGKGIYRSWGGDTTNQMPELYKRIIPSDPQSLWEGYARPVDLIVINLGTNDFGRGDPGKVYQEAYIKFVQEIRTRESNAYILLTSFKGRPFGKAVDQVFNSLTNEGFTQLGRFEFDLLPEDWTGCNNHTNLSAHKKMAEQLIAYLNQWLGWTPIE